MHIETMTAVDAWWAEVLGVDRVWREVTVRAHTTLGDYPGWYVAWRGAGVHVSAPASATDRDVEEILGRDPAELRAGAFWSSFGAARGLELRGPTVHAYLDVDPGPVDGVVVVDDTDLDTLRGAMTAAEWEGSGWTDAPVYTWGLVEGGRVVAAANLTDWGGTARDVGVAVAADHRGRGLAEVVGRHAVSHAIRGHGVARWMALPTNPASRRTAQRLGFVDHAVQLALRP